MVDRTAQLRKFFQQDPNLPTFPEHVRRMVALLEQPDTDLSDIARELALDPALSLRVLRLANSAVYGQRSEIKSLDSALAIVGLAELSAVIAGFAAVDGCERFLANPQFSWKDFWGHCSGAAFIARSLAEKLGLRLRGEEFLGGILHDIGYLALAKAQPPTFFAAVKEAEEEGGFLSQKLYQRFGFTVEVAGDLLAEASKLAPGTREIIRHVHSPGEAAEPFRPLVSVVSLASELAHLYGLTFFRGTAEVEVIVTALPAWKILADIKSEIAHWDLARLVLEIEHEQARAQDFVQVSHSH